MSTEATIKEPPESCSEDWFINQCQVTGEITLYVDYECSNANVVELTPELIKAIKSLTYKER